MSLPLLLVLITILSVLAVFYVGNYEEKPKFKAGDLITLNVIRERWEQQPDIEYKILEVGKKNYRMHSFFLNGERTTPIAYIDFIYRKVK